MIHALAATGGDLTVGFILACALALLAIGVRKWTHASELIEAERLRPEPVEPVDFYREIQSFKTARDEHLMGETRRAA